MLVVIALHADMLPVGWVGVEIFFALSGYLITGILLDARDTGAGVGAICRPFYVRRALRIFPLAFLVVGIVAVFERPGRQTWWHLSYIQNWLSYPPRPRSLGHYWTLAVEEQFYLVWPLVMLLTPRRKLLWACVGVLCLGLMARATVTVWDPAFANAYVRRIATPFTADCLAAGALLSVLEHSGGLERFRRLAQLLAWAASAVVVILAYWSIDSVHPGTVYTLRESALTVLIGATLWYVIVSPPAWLSWRWLRWVGTVSYGLYIIHGVIATWVRYSIPNPPLRLFVLCALSFPLAWLSWTYFEAPILKLKVRWPMPRRAADTVTRPAALAAPPGPLAR